MGALVIVYRVYGTRIVTAWPWEEGAFFWVGAWWRRA